MSCKLVNDKVPTYDVVKAGVTRRREQWGVVASATVPAIGKVIGHQRQEVDVSVGNNITYNNNITSYRDSGGMCYCWTLINFLVCGNVVGLICFETTNNNHSQLQAVKMC